MEPVVSRTKTISRLELLDVLGISFIGTGSITDWREWSTQAVATPTPIMNVSNAVVMRNVSEFIVL